MTRIGICSGSLRKQSLNTALVRAACALNPDVMEELSIAEFPLYNQDLEQSAFPSAVSAFQRSLSRLNGLIIVAPEYNRSIPGVMKNAIDWCSRSAGGFENVFQGKRIALAGVSPGRFGTVSAQSAWLPVFSSLGAICWGRSPLLLGSASRSFDSAGMLVDEALQERLQDWIAGFQTFCQS